MVRYVDESGKPHYVNTDYSTVPEQYRHQVETQLKAIEEEKKPTVPMMPPIASPTPAEPEQPPKKESFPVTLYLTHDWRQCLVMGMLLTKEGISVTAVDINTPDGKQKYDALKLTSVPTAVVENEIITGFDPSKVLALAQKKTQESPKIETPPPEKDLANPFQR